MLSVVGGLACVSAGPSAAATVAEWLFDEQVGAPAGSILRDVGPNALSLVLGRGGEIVPGRSGNALRAVAAVATNEDGPAEPGLKELGATTPRPAMDRAFAARLTKGDIRGRTAAFSNPTDSRINLGSDDWTIECWLRLDRSASEEGTIFEIGAGAAGSSDLVTRFSVLPRENAFALAHICNVSAERVGGVTRRVEYATPEGPPFGVAFLRSTTLATGAVALPRDAWIHVALVHTAATGECRLFVDGRQCANAIVEIAALPRSNEAYVSVARDGRSQRPLAGALDYLRISDVTDYQSDFTPPANLPPSQAARQSPIQRGR